MKTQQFCKTSSAFELDKLKKKQFCELPQYFNLTTSKTKQFCETSSFFEVENIKNEAILRDFFQTWKVENFSSLIWPAGSAPAALASLLFDPPEPQIIGKHSVSRLSYLFAHLDLLSSDSFSFSFFFSSLLFSSLLFSSLLFSDSSHLCFSSVHIVGSLTSKLPSVRPSIHRPCL